MRTQLAASQGGQAAAKGDRVGKLTPDERVAEAFGDNPRPGQKVANPATGPHTDLSHDDIQRLINQAHAATATQLIEARANIDLATQNAPDAIANTGSYSGAMPSPADFAAVYGVEEGGKRYQDFSREIDVGHQTFGMRTMPNQAIHTALRDAEPSPGTSHEDHARSQITAVAALKTLSMRRADPAGYVREVFPNVDAAWMAAMSPDSDDPIAYQVAIARSIAAQEQLGFENIQPLPNSFSADLTRTLGSGEQPHDASDPATSTLDASKDASGLKSPSSLSEAIDSQRVESSSAI